MILLIIILTLITTIIYKNIFGKMFNYAVVFNYIWCIASVITHFGMYETYVPHVKVYYYIFLMMFSFNAFTLIFQMVKPIKNKKINVSNIKEEINVKLINILNIIVICCLIPQFLNNLGIILTDGFTAVRSANLGNSSLNNMFIVWVLQPIIISTTVFSAISIVNRFKFKSMIFLNIITITMYSCIFGGRWLLVEMILLIAITVVMKYGLNIYILIKQNKKVVLIIGISMIMVVYITTQRSLKAMSFWGNLYFYLFGSLSLLGVYVSNPSSFMLNSDLLYGKVFFDGLLSPIMMIISKIFNFDYTPGITLINDVTQTFEYVSPTVPMNNNTTIIYPFLRDFGEIGLIICPFIIALIMYILYSNLVKRKSIFNLAIYIYAVSIIVFSLIEWMPARIAIIYCIPIMYISTKKIRIVK